MSDATGDDRRSIFSAWSLLPIQQMLAKRLAGKSPQPLESVAEKTWIIAPEETVACRPAIYLPHQLDRVTGWLFSSSEHPRSEIEAATAIHGATRGFLLKDAWLIDGTLYKGGASQYLSPRAGILPRIRAEHEFGREETAPSQSWSPTANGTSSWRPCRGFTTRSCESTPTARQP